MIRAPAAQSPVRNGPTRCCFDDDLTAAAAAVEEELEMEHGSGSISGHVRRLRTLKRRKEEKREAKNKVRTSSVRLPARGRSVAILECSDEV